MVIRVWKDYPDAIDLRNPVGETFVIKKEGIEGTEPFPRDCLVSVTSTEDIMVGLNFAPDNANGFQLFGGRNHTTFRVGQGDKLIFYAFKGTTLSYHTITWKP